MHVNALDHVNIVTDDLDGTAAFYAALLDLDRRNAPPPLTPDNAQWMYDAAGRAILHINSRNAPSAFTRPIVAGPTGAIHHVALNCTGYTESLARIEARGLAFACNEVTAIGLRQIFISDPNEVLLELNFFGD